MLVTGNSAIDTLHRQYKLDLRGITHTAMSRAISKLYGLAASSRSRSSSFYTTILFSHNPPHLFTPPHSPALSVSLAQLSYYITGTVLLQKTTKNTHLPEYSIRVSIPSNILFTTEHTLTRMSRNTKEFNQLADRFTEEYAEKRVDLEQCLQSRVNDDINFVCQRQKSAYLEGIAQIFCKKEYDVGVKCQKAAGERWASDCFKENVAFGQCTDRVLKQMYVYNLEHNKKNPAAN